LTNLFLEPQGSKVPPGRATQVHVANNFQADDTLPKMLKHLEVGLGEPVLDDAERDGDVTKLLPKPASFVPGLVKSDAVTLEVNRREAQ